MARLVFEVSRPGAAKRAGADTGGLFRLLHDETQANVGRFVIALLPDGRRQGREWVARNPCRSDRSPGSFKVNLQTGQWADFASGDKGGDLVSLVAYLSGLSQLAAARRLADALGLDWRTNAAG